MKFTGQKLSLAHCAVRLLAVDVRGPRLDLFIPATPRPGMADLVVIHELSRPGKPPAVEMTVWAQRPSPTNRHRSLGDPILLN